MRKIIIETYPITTPYVGLGEFCKQIGERLSKRANELRSLYDIELCFIVPPRFNGCYGEDVNYYCIPASLRWLLPFFLLKQIYCISHINVVR